MKLLILLVIILAIVWVSRRGKRPDPADDDPDAPPQDMLACSHCGLHMPGAEALPGRGGVFCSEAHRAAFEQAHPGP